MEIEGSEINDPIKIGSSSPEIAAHHTSADMMLPGDEQPAAQNEATTMDGPASDNESNAHRDKRVRRGQPSPDRAGPRVWLRVAACPADQEPFDEVNDVLYNSGVSARRASRQEVYRDCYAELELGPRLIPVPDDKRRLLCPLYAKDPTVCEADYTLTSIEELLVHLEDEHSHPESYCPVCWEEFETYEARDEHIRNRNCAPKPKPMSWGLNDSQLLHYRLILSHDWRVRAVYDAIFRGLQPGVQRAASMYWDNYTSFVIQTVVSVLDPPRVKMILLERRRSDDASEPTRQELNDTLERWRNQVINALLLPRAKEHRSLFERRNAMAVKQEPATGGSDNN